MNIMSGPRPTLQSLNKVLGPSYFQWNFTIAKNVLKIIFQSDLGYTTFFSF